MSWAASFTGPAEALAEADYSLMPEKLEGEAAEQFEAAKAVLEGLAPQVLAKRTREIPADQFEKAHKTEHAVGEIEVHLSGHANPNHERIPAEPEPKRAKAEAAVLKAREKGDVEAEQKAVARLEELGPVEPATDAPDQISVQIRRVDQGA